MASWKKRIKKHFTEVIKIKKSPHSIALGFAIGTFISNLPTPGVNILLGLLVSLLYTKVNKLSLFGGILFWNPLITPFTYGLSFKIGDFLLGNAAIVEYTPNRFEQFYSFSSRFLLGVVIVASVLAVASYFIVWSLAYLYQKKDGRR
ncbi:DUF2062 domain-containing protein [Candidatus Woesearchaeota archaeon]|nr:DUF2062 domain-containing protein [Candidatus Woesearchaeota archaeon]